jgi:hypothetical protein
MKVMNTEKTEQQLVDISREKLLALVRALIGGNMGRQDDEHPLPPGAWYPVIRAAMEQTNISSGHNFGEEVALNPQPLPPRFAFLVSVAQAVINRAELFQEIADAAPREGEQQGIIIVSGYVTRFVDDFCGTGFRLKYPFPGPRPPWFADELDGIDLVVMATQFEQAAQNTFSPDLRQNLADASARFVEAGLSKMQ